MSRPAVIRAEFTDYRPVKTRKVLQLVFEVPAEMQTEVFAALGYPIMGTSTWVAIAKLVDGASAPSVPERAEPAAPVVKAETKRSSRAFLMLQDKEFRKWLLPNGVIVPAAVFNEADYFNRKCDARLKEMLGIKSKSELDTDPEAAARFDALRTDFELRDLVR